jgi:uncharacterized membrane protein
MRTQLKSAALAILASALAVHSAFAQFGPPWQSTWSLWWFSVFRILLVLGLVNACVMIVVRVVRGPSRSRAALEILGERLARGEIGLSEYEEKRRLIVRS